MKGMVMTKVKWSMETNDLMPQWGVLAFCSSIHQVRLYHQRPACGWCLMHVGCDVSSASLGWNLLPLTVIIVLALVNSAVSPAG